jgi:hypothetical protein
MMSASTGSTASRSPRRFASLDPIGGRAGWFRAAVALPLSPIEGEAREDSTRQILAVVFRLTHFTIRLFKANGSFVPLETSGSLDRSAIGFPCKSMLYVDTAI